MGLYRYKPRFRRALGGVAAWLVGRGVHPDTLTGLAVAVSLLGGLALLLSSRSPGLLLLVPPLALLRIALNALDGLVASEVGLAPPWGAVLNELGDRLSDVALFGGLALARPQLAPLGAAALLATLLASHLGVLSQAAGGPRQYGGVLGKADRVLLLALAAPAAVVLGARVLDALLAVLLLGAVVTAAQRLRQAAHDLRGARPAARPVAPRAAAAEPAP